ncbi:hypothetical protein C8T65DRAFT_678893, partial [Cerioporus squamosus]
MCRFNSGPDVHFHCDIDFDPFLFMEDTTRLTVRPSSLAAFLPLTRADSVHDHDVRVRGDDPDA